jgi:hypothetical protein
MFLHPLQLLLFIEILFMEKVNLLILLIGGKRLLNNKIRIDRYPFKTGK